MSNQASLGDISDSRSSESNVAENERWRNVRLKKILSLEYGDNLPTDDRDEGDIPVYGANGQVDTHSEPSVDKPGVIIGRKGSIAESVFSKEPFWPIDTTYYISTDETDENLYYIHYLLDHLGLQRFNAASAIPGLNRNDAYNLKTDIAPKDEQRRIASVLYNVDQAISKTEEIIEQTQRVKKGLMQDLFTEGYYSHEEFEEHPLLGERPASWSVETVGDLTKKVQYGLSEALQEEGEYPIFRMNNYENGYMRDHPMKYIDLSEDEFRKYKVEKGDILFNRTNSHELVGKTGIFELEDDYVFASYLVRLRTNEKVDPYYLNFFMNSEEGQNRLKTFATKGVSQSNINASSVQKLKVPVPDKKEEQKKIVEVIKNLDKKIEWNKEYLEDLKSLKKGLMQDLLTGSVRTGEDVRVLDEVVV